ncbi:Lrp/AsnC family transcriptional regulator [Defluviimonas denitrificans]|jgi:Lrp/AsnC family transcriptional regulator|uniref:Lrp/AsnC family transcriptional regulator n=1 Tax=Albidovulum denitrificans TaxID=404881 RepID=A0A2S8SCW5_9RHOB|nr:Lrp/AsnC family transcriptional regulator [Defluviimonas denitrificans]PQV58697.1 Lrp/AsnC family transcriptional regulator [Defluviimonas denitrificans]
MEKIDTFDAKILRLIQADAALPLDEIGDKVGLSRNAVWRRIKAMEANGTITGRAALLDPAKLGLGLTVFMMIRTDRHAPDWLERFAKVTRDMPEILGAYRMTGELDYLIRARVADVKDYDRLYQAIVSRIELADVSASFVMEEIKETTVLPV